MTKRIFLLMGLAIFAVVLSHAAGWGQIALVNWADQYRPVAAPNFDAVGSPTWSVIVFVRQMTAWAVPAFLFCSGFFVSYAARSSRGVYTWKMARVRVVDLLIPYTIWSVIWFAADAIEHKVLTPAQYLTALIVGKADGGGYYFIPMLCQFYLLSPLIVPLAKSRPRQLLAAAVAIQLAAFVSLYLEISGVAVPPYLSWLTQMWLFFLWATYFALGLVFGFHSTLLKPVLLRYRWLLLGALLLLGITSIFEAELIFWATAMSHDLRNLPLTFSAWFFSIAFILAFVVFDRIAIPFPAKVNLLAGKSYGIYLLHLKAMPYLARIIRQIAPWMLAYQLLIFVPFMLIIGLAVPILLMNIVSRSPARRFYHYLFG